jgi:phosphoribosylaminoimidazolecarboxamide formyltransferase/IMP cyclohydrolase
MIKVKRVLISVSDKTGLIPLAKFLVQLDCEILSTGGTGKILTEAGINIIPVSDVTKFPEMLGGRVKTLHPNIHAGILAQRIPEHISQLKAHNIEPIDLVIVNLYPFETVITKDTCNIDEAIENIDIGGPTMIRAAAKNYKYVGVIVSPENYEELINIMQDNDNCIPEDVSYRWATEAFMHCAAYDTIISQYLYQRLDKDIRFPKILNLTYKKALDLRYGENPHQKAAFYHQRSISEPGVATCEQLHGKTLSFNNILDLDAAIELVKEFKDSLHACVIIKHNNPCGVALDDTQHMAYQYALDCDPVSAFGGIVGFNKEVTIDTAKKLTEIFIEAVVAPGYTQEALELLKTKKDLRILQMHKPKVEPVFNEFDIKKTTGGVLLQTRDVHELSAQNIKVVTKTSPSDKDMDTLMFAWRIVKHVKSNAIVLVKPYQCVGIGAGQTSRVAAVKIAIDKAGDKAQGTCMASDAFFPFPDSIEAAANAGVKAIIQPGGSIRDEEVIEIADKYNIAMVFTGIRHFKH